MKRLFGREEARAERTEMLLVESGVADPSDLDDVVEVEVVGEGSYQDAIERIAGPKEPEGKQMLVGATLRCEPSNEYDPNAVRVEVMGQLVGYLPRDLAAKVCTALSAKGGAVEGSGMIVGGWRDAISEGHFGVRVWLNGRVASELGIEEPKRRKPLPPLPPPAPHELRLSPPEASDVAISTLTITCEEHYQPAIAASCPDDEDRDRWNTVVSFAIADCNPHSKKNEQCLEVRIGDATVGYLTPAMSNRHLARVAAALDRGRLPTAVASVSKGQKGGQMIWRVKAVLPKE